MTPLPAIACTHAGTELIGRIALPDGPGPHPAVLVMHNAHGLGSQVIDVARALAKQGYVAIATDMYGGGAYAAGREEAGALLAGLWADGLLLRERVVAWFDLLRAQDGVDPARCGAIGYCFGGKCVLELARSGADVKAVASYHGLLTTGYPAAPGAIKGHVAIHTGARDPFVPQADVDALRAEMVEAGADWSLTEYSHAAHAFTDPGVEPGGEIEGLGYHPLAHRLSWAATTALLEAML